MVDQITKPAKRRASDWYAFRVIQARIFPGGLGREGSSDGRFCKLLLGEKMKEGGCGRKGFAIAP